MSSKFKISIKILSLFLAFIFIMQTMPLEVLAENITNTPNTVVFEQNYEESDLLQKYLQENKSDYATHAFNLGRAGDISLDDFNLEFGVSLGDIGIDGNLMPVFISHNYNSTAYKFLSAKLNMLPDAYGEGWLLSYNQFLCMLEFTDKLLIA